MNVWMTREQLIAVIGTLEWTADLLTTDVYTLGLGLEPRLQTFALKQAKYNRNLARELEEQR